MSSPGAVEMTDPRGGVRRVWWDYVAIVMGQVLTVALGLVGLSLVARLVGPDGYGTVALAISVVQFLYVIGVHWTMAASIRFGRERLIGEGLAGSFFWSWLPLVIGSFAIACLAVAAAMPLARRYVGLGAGQEALFFVLFSAVTLARAVEYLLQAAGRMRAYAVAIPIGRLVYVLLLATLPALTGLPLGPAAVILLMALGLAAQVLAGLPFLDGRLLRPVRLDVALTRRILVYSSPLLLSCSFGYLSDWVDHYVLRAFRTTAEIGVYHLAYQSMLFVSGVLAGVATLAFPILTSWRADGSDERCRRYLGRLVPQASVLWSLVLPVAGVAGGVLFPVLFAPGFEMGSRYLGVLLTGVVFQVVTCFYSAVFTTYDILGRATGVLLAMVAVNLVADLWLVPAWGPMGAAIGTATSYAVGAALYLVLGNRRLDLRQWVALVPPTLALPPLLALGGGLGLLPQLLLVAVSMSAIFWWSKQRRVFERADLAMFNRVELPGIVRAGMTKAYEILS